MITITEEAKKALHDLLSQKGEECIGLRLSVLGGVPGAYKSEFRIVRKNDPQKDDVILDQGTFKVYIDPQSAPKVKGAKIDYVRTFNGASFKIDYPTPEWDDPLAAKVQQLITDRINPGIAAHGGYVTLLDVSDGIVYLLMGGGCQGCGLASATLRQGIEVMIKEQIPEVREIIDQTDHAQGNNPYYKPAKDSWDSEQQSPLVAQKE